jgi:hypothetical protein
MGGASQYKNNQLKALLGGSAYRIAAILKKLLKTANVVQLIKKEADLTEEGLNMIWIIKS